MSHSVPVPPARGVARNYAIDWLRITGVLVVFFFQLALQSEIPAYVLGMARYPLLRYLLALSAAELPIAIGAVILGSGFLNRQYWLMVGVGLVGIGVVSLAIRALHRKLSKAAGKPLVAAGG